MKERIRQAISVMEALEKMAPESSKRSRLQWLRFGRVSIDGKVVENPKQILQPGQEIALEGKRSPFPSGIRKVFEDRSLVVIDKPAGILSVASESEKEETVHHILKRVYHPARIYVVHRLDQGTSGLLLFAKTPQMRDSLKELLERHEIQREYVAIVEGHPSAPEGTWDDYQYEDAHFHVHSTRDPRRGKRRITHYREVARSKKWSVLALQLETGGKNQIRVHCQQAGCPVICDDKYGAEEDPIHRLGLHAYRLTFIHPLTRKKAAFVSPVPLSFQQQFPSGSFVRFEGGHAPE